MTVEMTPEDAEKLAWLRAEVQKGIDDLEAGRVRDGETVMEEIRQMLRGKQARKEDPI